MPVDSYFSFDIRAEQINQAYYFQWWTYTSGSNLTIQNLAGGTTGTRGIYHTNYTDSPSNSANSNLLANISQFTVTSPGSTHTTGLLRYTNPGPPVPAVYFNGTNSAFDEQEFHGTCKPVSLGDWVRHGSQNAAMMAGFGFDGYFVTAGLDPFTNKIVINVNSVVDAGSTTSMTATTVTSISSGFPSGVNSTSKIRLFTHPSWVFGPQQYILLIGWDAASNIFTELYQWDGNNINSAGSANLGGSTNNMSYTGQHDIHFTNSGNILLQTWNSAHTAGTLFEINGSTLGVVGSLATTCVAYDPAYDIIGVRRNNNFETYQGSVTASPTSSVAAFTGGSLAYDAIWHEDELGVMYVGEQLSSTTINSHAFFYNGAGSVSTNTMFTNTMSNSVTFTQIERTSPNVLVNFQGPNYSNRPLFRSVCSSSIYRSNSSGGGVGTDYSDALTPGTYCEDIIQMKHPYSQDYTRVTDTNSDPTIAGNNHLISANMGLHISGWGQNLATKHWDFNPGGYAYTKHHQYILYLGYYLDSSSTDSFLYIAVTGLNDYIVAGVTNPGSPYNGGWISWVKFRNT